MSKNVGPVPLQAGAGCGAGRFGGLARDVGVDGHRRPPAGRDGLHHGGRAGLAVAAGEDALAAGEQGQLVGRDGALGGELADVLEVGSVDLLADGQDHRVGGRW